MSSPPSHNEIVSLTTPPPLIYFQASLNYFFDREVSTESQPQKLPAEWKSLDQPLGPRSTILFYVIILYLIFEIHCFSEDVL